MEANHIKRLHVKDFRGFENLNVNFNRGFNFIVGKNGCGKTSLLRAIILSYSGQEMNDSRYGENFEVWIDIVEKQRTKRIGIAPRNTSKNLYRNNPEIKYEYPSNNGVDDVYCQFDGEKLELCPLVLGAFRKIEYKKINGMAVALNVDEANRKYRDNAVKSLRGGELPNIKQWMIDRYFQIDKDWAIVEKENWEWLMLNLKNLGPNNVDFKFISIERELEPKFSINDEVCYLEELSSGFHSVLSMVFSIFEWIEAINVDEKRIVKNAEGVVIIDEIDVHLHPEWQLTLKKSLGIIFPNIQFIVTTHSPHMIAMAEPGEIIVLDKDENNRANLIGNKKSYGGWTTDQILEEIMGVRSLTNTEYEKLINDILISFKERNILKIKNLIEKIEKVAHPSDTIVSAFKIQLAELQLGD